MVENKSVLGEMVVRGEGEVVGSFVTKPGVMILSKTVNTAAAALLYHSLALPEGRASYELRQDSEKSAEFAARLTYLQFPFDPTTSDAYLDRMVEEYGHLSIYASSVVTFLIAGISTEASLELVAHKEASVSRLTSNRTKAQDSPMYAVRGEDARRYVLELEKRRSESVEAPKTLDERELYNRLLPCKATALTFTMNLKDYHKTFIGRLSHHGVEEEVREVCERMCEMLHALYPRVIREPAWYYAKNNAAKYDMG